MWLRRRGPAQAALSAAAACLIAAVGLTAPTPPEAAGGASTPPPHGAPAVRHAPAPAGPAADSVRLRATAALLMDARTGQVLYSRNARLHWPPASTTKIMTALVALESTPLDASVEISPQAALFREGSVVGLPAGARIPLHDLLYALMLPSGNDAALAVAEGVAGTVQAFVARMNSEAHRLGALDTHFVSPHGLYARDHYSTAYDLALITRVALRNPTFREIVRTRQWTFQPPGLAARVLWNHNRLLLRYPGADGVKTGYVSQSGQTLVASATKNGWQLIAVFLRTGDEWGDASRLLTYGFSHFRRVQLAYAGERVATIPASGAGPAVVGVVPQEVDAALPVGETVDRRVTVASDLRLPVRRGARVGTAAFYAGGRLIGSAPVVAAEAVEAPGAVEAAQAAAAAPPPALSLRNVGEFVEWLIARAFGLMIGAIIHL